MTVALNHRVEGPAEAAPLVLLNSLGTDIRMWDLGAELLREEFRLVRADTRGDGGSPVPYSYWAVADGVLEGRFTDRVEPDLDVRPDLGRIAAPTLAISGAEDGACPPDVARALADGVPGKEVILRTAVYAGVPRPNSASATALRVLAEENPSGGAS